MVEPKQDEIDTLWRMNESARTNEIKELGNQRIEVQPVKNEGAQKVPPFEKTKGGFKLEFSEKKKKQRTFADKEIWFENAFPRNDPKKDDKQWHLDLGEKKVKKVEVDQVEHDVIKTSVIGEDSFQSSFVEDISKSTERQQQHQYQYQHQQAFCGLEDQTTVEQLSSDYHASQSYAASSSLAQRRRSFGGEIKSAKSNRKEKRNRLRDSFENFSLSCPSSLSEPEQESPPKRWTEQNKKGEEEAEEVETTRNDDKENKSSEATYGLEINDSSWNTACSMNDSKKVNGSNECEKNEEEQTEEDNCLRFTLQPVVHLNEQSAVTYGTEDEIKVEQFWLKKLYRWNKDVTGQQEWKVRATDTWIELWRSQSTGRLRMICRENSTGKLRLNQNVGKDTVVTEKPSFHCQWSGFDDTIAQENECSGFSMWLVKFCDAESSKVFQDVVRNTQKN